MSKIIIIFIFVVLIFYGGYLGLFFSLNKNFSYNDVDLDRNHILTLSELEYFSNIGFKYKCLLDQNHNNSSICKTLEVEIFSLKDGLSIKKEKKADACCIFTSNKKASYKTISEVIFWDNKIVKPFVSKSWHDKQMIVGLKESHSKTKKAFLLKAVPIWEPVPDGHKGTHDPHWDQQFPDGTHKPKYP